MSIHIPVYKAEYNDGIAEQVRSTAAIAYCTQAEMWTPTKEWIEKVSASERTKFQERGVAGITDFDLFFARSILASTNWNNNDDVFWPQEVWMARHTPAHKPDNLNHDEKIIVGHMIDSWAIDDDGKVIAEDSAVDSLPSYYHLLNSSVIYRAWSDPERQKVIEELISDIQAGKAFVSMECLFRNFDYAVITPNGEHKIIARDGDSAFLTKHLRAYGGEGTFEGNRVGRLMRNLTFSGKGYVKRPANPASIVFTGENDIRFTAAGQINPIPKEIGVLISCKADILKQENNDMAEGNEKVLAEQIADLKATVKTLTDENKTLAEKSTKASVEKLEKTIADLTSQLEAANKTAAESAKAASEAKDSHDKLSKTHDETVKAKAELEKELSGIKAESVKVSRISTLVEGGVPKESATATVEKFAGLSDEQFAEIANMAIAAFPPKDDKDAEEKKKKDAKAKADADAAAKAAADKANASALEGAAPIVEPNLAGTSAGGDDAVEALKKSVAEYLESNMSEKSRRPVETK